jgi:hypothetical protein
MPSDATGSAADACDEHPKAGEAFSEAVSADLAAEPLSDDLRLSRVVAAWPALPEVIKAAIINLAMQS